MAVHVQDPEFGINALAKTTEEQHQAHESNSRALLNLSEGKKLTALRPAYDPDHPDNEWPKMLHHAVEGERIVGRNLKGLPDATPDDKKRRLVIQEANQSEYEALLANGWQSAPFPKPQVAVMDPLAEKAELKRQNSELQGQITHLQQKFEQVLAKLGSDQAKPAKPAK